MKNMHSNNKPARSISNLSDMLRCQRSLINKEASLKIPSDYLFIGSDVFSMTKQNALLKKQIALLEDQLLLLKDL